MRVFTSCIDEARPCRINVRSAARVIAVVCGNGAGRNRDQARTGMRMPPAVTSWLKRVSDDIELRSALRVDAGLPRVRFRRDVDLVEADATRAGTSDELR